MENNKRILRVEVEGELEEQIRQLVDSGKYAHTSELVRAAIRYLIEKKHS